MVRQKGRARFLLLKKKKRKQHHMVSKSYKFNSCFTKQTKQNKNKQTW